MNRYVSLRIRILWKIEAAWRWWWYKYDFFKTRNCYIMRKHHTGHAGPCYWFEPEYIPMVDIGPDFLVFVFWVGMDLIEAAYRFTWRNFFLGNF